MFGGGSAIEGVYGLGPAAVKVLIAGQVVAFLVEGLEEELGDVGESAGVAAVHASGGDVGEEFAEDEIDGDRILEIATEIQEFGADFRGGLQLEKFAMVEEAECSGGVMAEHAAAAAVGELEDAAISGVVGGARFFAAHVRLVSLKLRPAAGSGAVVLAPTSSSVLRKDNNNVYEGVVIIRTMNVRMREARFSGRLWMGARGGVLFLGAGWRERRKKRRCGSKDPRYKSRLQKEADAG